MIHRMFLILPLLALLIACGSTPSAEPARECVALGQVSYHSEVQSTCPSHIALVSYVSTACGTQERHIVHCEGGAVAPGV